MKEYSFYHSATGDVHPARFSTTDASQLAQNTPPDHVAVEGNLDHLSQRVNVTTGEAVDYHPPAPSADHEWNDTKKRWVLKASIQAAQLKRAQALAKIQALEGSQARPLRDLALNPSDADARQRLLAIDQQIITLRAQLSE